MTTTCQGCGTQFAQRPTGQCPSCHCDTPAAPAAPTGHAQDNAIKDIAISCGASDTDMLMVAVRTAKAVLASQTTAPALSEPVAYLCTRPSGFAWPLMPKDVTPAVREALEADGVVITPLATPNQTPAPAAQGLTDAALDAAVKAWFTDVQGDSTEWRARMRRAILAASRTTPTPGEAK